MAKGYEQNQAESERETVAVVREMYRLSKTAGEWYSTWVNNHPETVRADLETIERKLRLMLEAIEPEALTFEPADEYAADGIDFRKIIKVQPGYIGEEL